MIVTCTILFLLANSPFEIFTNQLDICICHWYVFSYLTEIKEFNVSSPYLSLTNSATIHIAKRASEETNAGETVANIVHGLGKHGNDKKYASCDKNDAQQCTLSSSPKVCNKQKSDIAVPLAIEQNTKSKYLEGNGMSKLASFEWFIFITMYFKYKTNLLYG